MGVACKRTASSTRESPRRGAVALHRVPSTPPHDVGSVHRPEEVELPPDPSDVASAGQPSHRFAPDPGRAMTPGGRACRSGVGVDAPPSGSGDRAGCGVTEQPAQLRRTRPDERVARSVAAGAGHGAHRTRRRCRSGLTVRRALRARQPARSPRSSTPTLAGEGVVIRTLTWLRIRVRSDVRAKLISPRCSGPWLRLDPPGGTACGRSNVSQSARRAHTGA